ncbi:MAG: bacterial regulatory s, tetR family protein [Ilumatobacteraceae bacterium]|nr:bacterial regulatory s, tetR family protein [Ilumatobacteraceae bacterium]
MIGKGVDDVPRVIDSRTRTKILQAALHHVALFGEERLSMSGIAEEAGLSRGTVYRYFTNRDEIRDALAEHVRANFRDGVERASQGKGDTRVKLQRIIESRVDPETRLAVRRLRDLQPAFTLNFLTLHLPDFVDVYEAALKDDFDRPDLRLSLHVFAQIIARIAVTETLFDDDPERITALGAALWDAIQPRQRADAHQPREATSV